MPRLSTIQLAVLNITTHPHSAKIYADLFEGAFKRNRRPFKLRGDYYGLVQSCFRIDENNPEDGLEGDLIRFLQIRTDEPWFNLDRVEPASDEEMKEIHIPEHLRPHSQRLRYVFFPRNHRLVYVEAMPKAALSPRMAETLILQFLNARSAPDAPQVNVIAEKSKEGLDEIVKMPQLRELDIVLTRPNADDFSAVEKAVTDELEKQHAAEMRVDLKAEKGHSLKPNDRNQKLARVAVSNGVVVGRGQDENGRPMEVSTADHPYIASFKERLGKINLALWLRAKGEEVIRAVREALK